MNPISTQPSIDWELLFENVTEAVSGYEAAVAEGEHSAWGPESGSLFVRCLSDRSRVRQALAWMQENVPPQAYQRYRSKLETRFQRCESRLEHIFACEGRRIQQMFAADGECGRLLDELDRRIGRLIRALKDWFLVHDPEEDPEDGLEDLAFDGIALLTDCHRVAQNPPEALNGLPAFEGWRNRLIDIEKRFEIDFGYLEPVAALLRRMADREFPTDCRWFMRMPQISDAPDSLKMPEVSKVQRAEVPIWRDSDETACPEVGQVIAYALHELDSEIRRTIRHHVYACSNCLNLVLDVRAAHHEALGESPPDVDWASYLQNVLTCRMAADAVGLGDRPSEAVWAAVRKRFDAVLDWSRLILKEAQPVLEVLLAAPFRRGILPMMASDHEGRHLVAKWVQVREGRIEGIRPTVVFVHRLDENDSYLTMSVELAESLPPEPNKDPFVFGWEMSDGSVQTVEPQWIERKERFIAVHLQKPSPSFHWEQLRMMVVVSG